VKVTTHKDRAVARETTPATSFEYQRAETWQEAVKLLGLWEGEAKIIAGGQSLVPMLNLRLAFPAALIDVDPIGADAPRMDGDQLVLPAMTRHQVLVTSPLVREHAPLLAHAVRFVGNVRVRNRGTVGGSLAHADPTAEIAAVVLVMRGRVTVLGPRGERTVDAVDFFVTYLTTAVEADEVITEVRLPTASTCSWGFEEVVRRYSDFATVSVSVLASGVRSDGVDDLRVALGGVADRPVLVAPDLLTPIRESPGDLARARAVATAVADSLEPDSDLHGSADYRRRLVAVHTRRLLEHALREGDV